MGISLLKSPGEGLPFEGLLHLYLLVDFFRAFFKEDFEAGRVGGGFEGVPTCVGGGFEVVSVTGGWTGGADVCDVRGMAGATLRLAGGAVVWPSVGGEGAEGLDG